MMTHTTTQVKFGVAKQDFVQFLRKNDLRVSVYPIQHSPAGNIFAAGIQDNQGNEVYNTQHHQGGQLYSSERHDYTRQGVLGKFYQQEVPQFTPKDIFLIDGDPQRVVGQIIPLPKQ
jgi:hypothetical protein